MNKVLLSGLLSLSLAIAALTGCTVFGEKNPPTLKSTTSAEQFERIYWSTVKGRQWTRVPGMLAANVAYRAGGKLMGKDQVLPYLQSLSVTDFTITDLSVKPNGPDMTLTYTLQWSGGAGPAQTLNVISVWQQVGGNYVLIVHTEQPAG